jgi:lipopolysaccharide export system ATP-binding protein
MSETLSIPTQASSSLRAEHLVKIYKQRSVVRDVSLEVRQGEVVGLLGPNGAGKTTSFYMIVGAVRPNGGAVFFDNDNITTMPMFKRAKRGIGYLPQEASVFRKMSVEDNITAILELQKLNKNERKERLEQLLEDFGIQHIRKSKGYMLSGGERRRCEIARALATNPKFMLLDEPFAGIDPIAVEEIIRIVRSLKERGIGVLITDHNVHETLSITDRAYILIDGQVFYSGTAEEIADNEEVRKRYLGASFKLERYEMGNHSKNAAQADGIDEH